MPHPPPPTDTTEDDPALLQTRIDTLGRWFHNLHLPGGLQTCPQHPLGLGDFPAWK